jgi:DNA-binding SARP family transcriptional activator
MIRKIQVCLLGSFCIVSSNEEEEATVTYVSAPRTQAILAYLALNRHAPQLRHQLAYHFWPESSESQALTNLRGNSSRCDRCCPR